MKKAAVDCFRYVKLGSNIGIKKKNYVRVPASVTSKADAPSVCAILALSMTVSSPTPFKLVPSITTKSWFALQVSYAVLVCLFVRL